MSTLEKLKETCDYVRSKSSLTPEIGIVLGSGLGDFVDAVTVDVSIPYSEIPHFVPPSVVGHGGDLVIGQLNGKSLAILKGRVHYYEGHSMDQVIFPVRSLGQLGVKTLILTNSAGGMLEGMQPADLMIIEDHINLMGTNPLIGNNEEELGPRFPDMTDCYKKHLIEKMKSTFQKLSLKHHSGVYCGLTGPSYETPAEIRYLKTIGAGAAGMSTVPEAIAANHMGIDVCGVSCITNLAAGISPEKLSHDEVTENAAKAAENFKVFLKTFISEL